MPGGSDSNHTLTDLLPWFDPILVASEQRAMCQAAALLAKGWGHRLWRESIPRPECVERG